MTEDQQEYRNPFRRLYEWTLSWADTPHGKGALFLLAFAEATIFPIPPDVLLVALVLGARTRAFVLAAVCTAGSVLGGITGFGIGFFFWETTKPFFFQYVLSRSTFTEVRVLYDQNLFLIIFSAAFSPIPFKVFTIASGVFAEGLAGFRLARFFLIFLSASIGGRAIRFFLVSYLLYRYGKPIRSWIEKYFNLFTLLAVLLLGLLVLLSRWS